MPVRFKGLIAAIAVAAWAAVVGVALSAKMAVAQDAAPDAPPADDKKNLVPIEKTNCVNCHLKAGRELTAAVHTFVHSVHDFAGLSCNDCHGGNLEIDDKAHLDEFGFIGTKLSAHQTKCKGCHEDQAGDLAKGPHAWDHDKQLNTKMPLCVDCHGNHDVGNIPAEFSLSLVCLDCHKDYKEKFAAYASVTDANDELWNDLRAYKKTRPQTPEWAPEGFKEEIAAVRAKTAAIIHRSGTLSDAEAKELLGKVSELRKKLAPAPAARGK